MNESSFNDMTIEELCQNGSDYKDGRNGKVEDREIAEKYFEAAAKKGSLDAMNSLISMFIYYDMEKTDYWFKEAANTGDSFAMLGYANWLFYDREDLPEFKSEAFQWLEKAALAGEAEAIWRMAVHYEYGLPGAEQDFEKAKHWYQEALDGGDKEAEVYVRLMEKRKVDPADEPFTWWREKWIIAHMLIDIFSPAELADTMYSKYDIPNDEKFTKPDIDECMPLLEKIIEYSILSRKEGLLALEENVEDEQDALFKIGLKMAVDGTLPDLIQETMKTFIQTEKSTGSKLLGRLIAIKGIDCIQNGVALPEFISDVNSLLDDEDALKIVD